MQFSLSCSVLWLVTISGSISWTMSSTLCMYVSHTVRMSTTSTKTKRPKDELNLVWVYKKNGIASRIRPFKVLVAPQMSAQSLPNLKPQSRNIFLGSPDASAYITRGYDARNTSPLPHIYSMFSTIRLFPGRIRRKLFRTHARRFKLAWSVLPLRRTFEDGQKSLSERPWEHDDAFLPSRTVGVQD